MVSDDKSREAVNQESVTDEGFRIVLVSCTNTKRDEPSPARELYDPSPYFRKQRLYAEHVGDEWWIQSAKHGLLHPDEVIEPYDKNAGDLDDPESWAETIATELWARRSTEASIDVLGGTAYADPLVPLLEEHGFTVNEPVAGLRIGERMEQLEALAMASAGGSASEADPELVTDGGQDLVEIEREVLEDLVDSARGDLERLGQIEGYDGVDETIEDLVSTIESAEAALDRDPELVTDGGLPFAEEDVIVRRARLEPGLGDEADDVDEDSEPIADGGSEVAVSERFWVEEEPADDPILTDMLRIRREVKSEDGVEYLGTLAHIPTEYGPDVLEALADHYDRDLSTENGRSGGAS